MSAVVEAGGRSPGTQASYRRRVENLRKRYAESRPAMPRQRGFAEFVIGLKGELTASSWRQYKASMVAVLEQELSKLFESDVGATEHWHICDTADALDLLKVTDQSGTLRSSTRTSARKAKHFPSEHRLLLEEAARNYPSIWGRPLAQFLRANVLAGLRPIEWTRAVLTATRDDGLMLIVQNAKRDEVRAHGDERSLYFPSLAPSDRAVMADWYRHAQHMHAADRYDMLIEGIGGLLRDLCAKQRFPARTNCLYTLYSTRHQFAIVAKAAGLLPAEIAALLGHAVDMTAFAHYGRPSSSSKGLYGVSITDIEALPVPKPEEVARVRKNYEESLQQLKRRKEKFSCNPITP